MYIHIAGWACLQNKVARIVINLTSTRVCAVSVFYSRRIANVWSEGEQNSPFLGKCSSRESPGQLSKQVQLHA
jgi:hypothetical protein